MTEINMSYGKIDVESFAQSVKDNCEKINPAFVWDYKAIEFDNLTPKSVVVEVGGYTGSWIYRISKKYNPKVYVFEPQKWCCVILRELLKEYNCNIFQYGLGTFSGHLSVDNFETDGCKFDETKVDGTLLPIRDIKEVFTEIRLKKIDVMHINIEGGEFTLIPYMFKVGIFPNVLMFATHGWEKEITLLKSVKKYYNNIWDYGTNLSAWKLKEKK